MDSIKTHPILSHQQNETILVLNFASDLLDILKTKRPDVIDIILIDVIIKLFRQFCCTDIVCDDCNSCMPSRFMNESNFLKFISQKQNEIISTIENGFNNSFNVPQRGMIIQYVIDKSCENDDNLIILEIGCGGGLIGKVLTNSNYSKILFSKKPFTWRLAPDNRFVQYYGIDPNLTTDFKQQLMMINGDSQEMQFGRNLLILFNKDQKITNENIYLDKIYLNKTSMPNIANKISLMLSHINNGKQNKVILLTSIMKYHFKYIADYKIFMNNLLHLAKSIDNHNNINGISYISNEVYGSNGLLYPFESDEYYQLLAKSNKIEKGVIVDEIIYNELTQKF